MKKKTSDFSFLDSGNSFDHPCVLYVKKAHYLLKKGKSVEFLPNKPEVSSIPNLKDQFGVTRIFYTSGSSGSPKQVFHDQISIQNAIFGLRERIFDSPLNSVCCLPVNHVGGWMQIERAISSGGKVFFCDYHDLMKVDLRSKLSNSWISLVPTQLYKLLNSHTARQNLRTANGIFVGGSHLPEFLASKARYNDIPLCPCYGMSETAGMITLLGPTDFLVGLNGVGEELNHASIRTLERDDQIVVRTKSLCLRLGDKILSRDDWLTTMDTGVRKEGVGWQIGTRLDRIINSGGEKVNPTTVENLVMESGLVEKCFVFGMEDDQWGQKVVIELVMKKQNLNRLKEICRLKLKNYEFPKKWNLVKELPVSKMGKVRSRN